MNSSLIKSSLILAVFLLFLANASGLLSLQLDSGLGLSISSPWHPSSAASGPLQFLSGLVLSTEFLLFIIIGMALSLLLPTLSPILGSALTVLLALPPVFLTYQGWLDQTILPMEYFLLTIFIIYTIHVLIGYFQETQAKQDVINTFSHFVPPEIVREICRSGKKISLDGESRMMTVLFADLVNFTSTAEKINPRELTQILNEYFTAMTQILHNYGVTIDKYIGDSIMAFSGAPMPQADHADRTVRAALDMQKELQRLAKSFSECNWPTFDMHVGINTGLMSVGNMGTQHRITYTVIGDAVNTACRLDKLTREYEVPIIVNGTTREATKSIKYRFLDHISVRGKQTKSRIYEPICLLEESDKVMEERIRISDSGVNFYIAGNYREAHAIFQDLWADYPQDGFYRSMFERVTIDVN